MNFKYYCSRGGIMSLKNIIYSILGLVLIGLVLLFTYAKKNDKHFFHRSPRAEVVAFNDWSEFKTDSERFKISLPHAPQYAKEILPNRDGVNYRKYEMYMSERPDGHLFW